MVLESLPDEELMRTLEQARGRGRDGRPARAMRNPVAAVFVFGRQGIESPRRELSRNAQPRTQCGFDMFRQPPVPSSATYSRFVTKLLDHQEEASARVARPEAF